MRNVKRLNGCSEELRRLFQTQSRRLWAMFAQYKIMRFPKFSIHVYSIKVKLNIHISYLIFFLKEISHPSNPGLNIDEHNNQKMLWWQKERGADLSSETDWSRKGPRTTRLYLSQSNGLGVQMRCRVLGWLWDFSFRFLAVSGNGGSSIYMCIK